MRDFFNKEKMKEMKSRNDSSERRFLFKHLFSDRLATEMMQQADPHQAGEGISAGNGRRILFSAPSVGVPFHAVSSALDNKDACYWLRGRKKTETN